MICQSRPSHAIRLARSYCRPERVSFSTSAARYANEGSSPGTANDGAWLEDIASSSSRPFSRASVDASTSPSRLPGAPFSTNSISTSDSPSRPSPGLLRIRRPMQSTGTFARPAAAVDSLVRLQDDAEQRRRRRAFEHSRQQQGASPTVKAAGESPTYSTMPSSHTINDLMNTFRGQHLNSNIHRRFRPGDVYSAKDLGDKEYRRWQKRQRLDMDAFDALGLDPMRQYFNISIMSEYMTTMGRIRNIEDTGLRPVNQRKIGRAIRRSVALGLMPSVHRHPEILMGGRGDMSKFSHSLPVMKSR